MAGATSKPKFKPGTGKHLSDADERAFSEGDFHVRGRFWLEGGKETFLGYGRVVLLERIKEYGSITKAAKSMKMSYRHAWELIESMNLQHGKPLIISTVGGRGGGGATLTPEGARAILIFRRLHERFRDFLKDLEIELDELKKQSEERRSDAKG